MEQLNETQLRALVLQFADGEACHYDHHDYCQTHFLGKRPCPYEIANEMTEEPEAEPGVMHTIKLEVTRDRLEKWNGYWSMFSGFTLTPEQMLEIFLETEKGRQWLIRSLQDGFDTGEREMFNELFSEKLIGSDWLCFGDRGAPKYEGFYERLIVAAEKAGYKRIQEE